MHTLDLIRVIYQTLVGDLGEQTKYEYTNQHVFVHPVTHTHAPGTTHGLTEWRCSDAARQNAHRVSIQMNTVMCIHLDIT